MNIQYISGFFDADGSITLTKSSKGSFYRYPKIDLTNTKLKILQSIQKYLKLQDIKSYISNKPARKQTHSISYVLSISNNYAIKLCNLLTSHHPMKYHRINVILKYYTLVTLRNGKYNSKQQMSKLAFERLFFWSSIS